MSSLAPIVPVSMRRNILCGRRTEEIARSGVQMETGDEFLNFNLIRYSSFSQERTY